MIMGLQIVLLMFFIFSFSHGVESSMYSLSAVDPLNGNVSLERFNGMVSLVVNVASQCGYTDLNYKELVKLQDDYNPRGFNVLAFPCNQFGQQEPATDQEIRSFTSDVYNINFPIFSKSDVLGEGANDVYRYLVGKTKNVVSWNFCKYLVDRHGDVVQFFSVKDDFSKIRRSIEYLLSKHEL